MKPLLKLTLSLLGLVSLPLAAEAKPFSQLVAFSGALTDTGNYAAEKGDYPAPFYRNRTTNGPVAVDVLASRLGLHADPSLHLGGQAGGTNFAVADALAGGHGPHDLPAQLKAHLDREGGKADPDALYFLFIGGNDVVVAAMTPDGAKAEHILDDAVLGIETTIHTLVAAGAKTIMAPDFIDLGVTPVVRQMGQSEHAKRISDEYNRKFDAMLDRVDQEKSFDLVRWRFGDFVQDLVARNEEFGFTNATDSCVALAAAGRCDFDRFIFFNEQYPTAKVHELMGSAMALAVLQRDQDHSAAATVAGQ